jgi:homoserine kinase type II
MAVYTEVAGEDLESFLAAYDIGRLQSFKGIAEGVENTNYLLRTERGSFILTLYEKRVAAGDLPFFIGLMEHLAARGIACPTPVRDRAGDAIGSLLGRPAAIVTFLDGVSVFRPTARHCSEVGGALASLHEAARGFAIHRPNALSLEGWARLVEAGAPRADEVAPGLRQMIESEFAFLQANWPQNLPQGVIHADLFPDNVFFLQERLSGLIDFYFACEDLFAYDVAICLNAWCFEKDVSFNVTKGRRLLSAYHAARPLGRDEIEALPILARGASLRFLLTRLVDWLSVPPGALVKPKDPLEYARRLRFNATARDVSAFGWDGR